MRIILGISIPFPVAVRGASLVAQQNSTNVIVYKVPESSTAVVIGVTLSVVNLSAHQQIASQPSKGGDRWSLGGSLSGGCELLAES